MIADRIKNAPPADVTEGADFFNGFAKGEFRDGTYTRFRP